MKLDYDVGDYVVGAVKPVCGEPSPKLPALATGFIPVKADQWCGVHGTYESACARLVVTLMGQPHPDHPDQGWTACAFRKYHGPEEPVRVETKQEVEA